MSVDDSPAPEGAGGPLPGEGVQNGDPRRPPSGKDTSDVSAGGDAKKRKRRGSKQRSAKGEPVPVAGEESDGAPGSRGGSRGSRRGANESHEEASEDPEASTNTPQPPTSTKKKKKKKKSGAVSAEGGELPASAASQDVDGVPADPACARALDAPAPPGDGAEGGDEPQPVADGPVEVEAPMQQPPQEDHPALPLKAKSQPPPALVEPKPSTADSKASTHSSIATPAVQGPAAKPPSPPPQPQARAREARQTAAVAPIAQAVKSPVAFTSASALSTPMVGRTRSPLSPGATGSTPSVRALSPTALGLKSPKSPKAEEATPRTAGGWNRNATYILNSMFGRLEAEWQQVADGAGEDEVRVEKAGIQLRREALLNTDILFANLRLDERSVDAMDKQAGGTGWVGLVDLVRELFPAAAKWEQRRYFATDIPFDLILVLKGSIGHGRGCTRYLPRTDRAFFTTYETITRNSAGRLSLAQLLNAGEMIGSMHFPAAAFHETAERYSVDPSEYRATFWEVLATLFPRLPEEMRDRYAATFIDDTDIGVFDELFQGHYFIDIATFKRELKELGLAKYEFSNGLAIDALALRFLDRDRDGKVSLYEVIQSFYPNVAPPYIKRAIQRHNHAMKYKQLQEYEDMMKCNMRLPVIHYLHDGRSRTTDKKKRAKSPAANMLTEQALKALEDMGSEKDALPVIKTRSRASTRASEGPFDESDEETCRTLSTTSDRSIEREDQEFEQEKSRLPTLRILEVLKGIHKDFSPLNEIERRMIELDTMREVPYKVFLAQQNVKDITAAIQDKLLQEKAERRTAERERRAARREERRAREEARAAGNSDGDTGLQEASSRPVSSEVSLCLETPMEMQAMEIWRRQSDYVELLYSDSEEGDDVLTHTESTAPTPEQGERRSTNYAVTFDQTMSAQQPAPVVRRKRRKPWTIPREFYTQPDVEVVSGNEGEELPLHAAQISSGLVCGIDHRKSEEQSTWYRNGTHVKPEVRRSDRRALRIGGTNMTSTKTNKVSDLLNYENYDIYLTADALSGDATNSPNVLSVLEDNTINLFKTSLVVGKLKKSGRSPEMPDSVTEKTKRDAHVYGSAMPKTSRSGRKGRSPAPQRSRTVPSQKQQPPVELPQLQQRKERGTSPNRPRVQRTASQNSQGRGVSPDERPARKRSVHVVAPEGVAARRNQRAASIRGDCTPPFTPRQIQSRITVSSPSPLALPQERRPTRKSGPRASRDDGPRGLARTRSQASRSRDPSRSARESSDEEWRNQPNRKPIPPQLERYERDAPRPRHMSKVMSLQKKRKERPPDEADIPTRQRTRGGRGGDPYLPNPADAPRDARRAQRPRPAAKPNPPEKKPAAGGSPNRRFRTSFQVGDHILDKWGPSELPQSPALNYLSGADDFPGRR